MPDTPFRIRDATLRDAPEIAALMCELGYETGRVEMERRLQSILSDRLYKTLVAAVDDRVCGIIGTHSPTQLTNTTIQPAESWFW